MSELRQNLATNEWVVIATERAKRPHDFSAKKTEPLKEDLSKCPFCPGNEKSTPEEILALPNEKGASPSWRLRVIPNMFPALTPQGSLEREKIDGFYNKMQGVGKHEVIIETPDHYQCIATMQPEQVEDIFLTYRARYRALSESQRFEAVIIFKNHGENAGTSLRHPHSQIIAMPITPGNIRRRLQGNMRYFDDEGLCAHCTMIEKEKLAKERTVLETEGFIVIEPFASHVPFETMVLPKKHDSSFSSISDEECRELARAMQLVLKKLYKGLDNPSFNYMIFSSPCHEPTLDYFHWFISVVPRVSNVAGFELGSGVFINPVIPESAAQFLRDTEV